MSHEPLKLKGIDGKAPPGVELSENGESKYLVDKIRRSNSDKTGGVQELSCVDAERHGPPSLVDPVVVIP